MPSGKTHDAITLILAAPVFAAAFTATHSIPFSAVTTGAFLFGGLMFGPDLDTVSKQYSRWWVFKLLWYPYRMFFPHRSRWSHGLVFGTLFRVVYFMGVLTLLAFSTCYLAATLYETKIPDPIEFARGWQRIGQYSETFLGGQMIVALFVGMWCGAASHTFTDMAVSYIKTGRVTEFL